mgnify:CR=1 FL=1
MADDWNMPEGNLMKGKRGIVMGVANQNSIAWGISKQLAAQGAEIAFTYQGENFGRRVKPLADSVIFPAALKSAAEEAAKQAEEAAKQAAEMTEANVAAATQATVKAVSGK